MRSRDQRSIAAPTRPRVLAAILGLLAVSAPAWAQPAADDPADEPAAQRTNDADDPPAEPAAQRATAGEPGAGEPAKPAADAAGAATPPGPLAPPALPAEPRFSVVPLHGEVSLGMAAVVVRAVENLEADDVLILDINTFGGRVDAAVKIRDALLSARSRNAFTVAYVHPRAISAGALISLATDVIAVAPAASIGAATPVQAGSDGKMQSVDEKVTSYMRTEMRATAEARGRSGDIAEAMVDADFEIPGLSEKGKLLTLDGKSALEWGVASVESEDLDELLADLGHPDAEVREVQWSWADKLAGWLTSGTLSGLLMTVGMLALMIGLYSGGAPLPLAIGGISLGVFFFGHHVVNLAGFEELLLFALGCVLIAVEVIAPGNLIPGVLGILFIVASLVLGLIDLDTVPLSVQWSEGWITRALATVFGSICATALLAFALFRYFPESRLGHRLLLPSVVEGRANDEVVARHAVLVGQSGEAVTSLRPSGRVAVAGARYDAEAVHGYIDAGSPVKVIGARGFALLVKAAPAAPEPAPEDPASGDPAAETGKETA